MELREQKQGKSVTPCPSSPTAWASACWFHESHLQTCILGGGGAQEQSGPRDHTGATVRGCKQSAQFLPGTAGWYKPDGQDEEAALGKGDMAQAGMETGQGGGKSEARASTGW